jgi:hypothetical protein
MYRHEVLVNGYRPYCLAGTTSSSPYILRATWFMALLDILTSIGDLMLRAYSRRQLKE